MSLMELATFVFVAAAFFGALTFFVSLVVWGNWRANAVGRWLVWFTAMLLSVLSLAFLIRLGVPARVIDWLRLAAFGFMAVMLWRQVWLFWRAAPARRRGED